jgi:hypothetical protein
MFENGDVRTDRVHLFQDGAISATNPTDCRRKTLRVSVLKCVRIVVEEDAPNCV